MEQRDSVLTLENCFEFLSVEDFRQHIQALNISLKNLETLELSYQSQWIPFIEKARLHFREEENVFAKIFWLHKMVAASEEHYDLTLRDNLIRLWAEVPCPFENFYGQYYFQYEKAVGFFFSGALKQAQNAFLICYNLALQNKWELGQLKAEFHLALVERDLKQMACAQEKLERIQKISLEKGFQRLEAKSRALLVGWAQKKRDFLAFMAERDFASARKILLEMEVQRRAEGKLKNRESLGAYLALYRGITRNSQIAKRIFFKCEDAIVKRDLLLFKQRHFALDADEVMWLKTLEGEQLSPAHSVLIEKLQQSKSSNVSALLQIFLDNSDVITKEQICQKLWRYTYNPTTHDNKIYKAMNELRRLLPSENLILNTYGGYRINSDWKH